MLTSARNGGVLMDIPLEMRGPHFVHKYISTTPQKITYYCNYYRYYYYTTTTIPVSYTHLDVYKRQPLNRNKATPKTQK